MRGPKAAKLDNWLDRSGSPITSGRPEIGQSPHTEQKRRQRQSKDAKDSSRHLDHLAASICFVGRVPNDIRQQINRDREQETRRDEANDRGGSHG